MATFPSGNAVCNSFKDELLEGVHDFRTTGGDTFRIALYTDAAGVALDASTTAYTTTTEVVGTGYTAGGGTLVNISPVLSGSTALVDFQDFIFSASTITARGALIYNSTPAHGTANSACVVLDFGSNRTSTAGDFTIVFPAATAGAAIIRIA